MILSILAAVTTVVSAVSTIGPMVATLCTTVVPRILPILRTGVEICKIVATVAEALGVVYKVLRPGESVSDIGDRALQAGKGPEAFENFDAYMQSLRELKLDPSKSQEYNAESKLVAGLGVVAGGLDERFRVRSGTMANLWSLIAVPEYFTQQRLEAIIARTREIANVVKYFDGTLMPADAMRMESLLVQVEKDVDPHKSDDACHATLNDVAARMRASSH
ncbi:hypothetical protein SAMN05880566_105106 [Janthinobacterium sp. TND4EL3]|uniref:hypothetical protein n=1 Tax=Janthinobacterium sp. TND4EL3 TaxID=1907311 RepID=UPI000955DB62|nr:hypothetical protein [Janthinobacterium sp. TND4EL3]SIQ72162.1 hypothetical protein SAMN05880566_105106 [Janthinobacterium sp. TND4EL3]